MKATHIVHSALAVVLTLSAAFVEAKEVTLPYQKLTLNANLELAADKKLSDGVIVITHGTLAHRGMEAIVYLQSLFKERGYNTLAINLSLGVDNRHDMYDCKATHRHRNEDAADEISAWVGWLKGQGVNNVAVLGHSRGGAQTALYAAQQDDAAVKAVVLLAPAIATNSSAADYEHRFNKPLAPILAKAQKLVAAGKGDAIMEHTDFLYCPDANVTAAAFASYYGGSPNLDTPAQIPGIQKPVFVVIAGSDEVVTGLDKLITPLADGKRVRMHVIDGSDHFFRDLFADDAVDAIDAFLKSTGYAQ